MGEVLVEGTGDRVITIKLPGGPCVKSAFRILDGLGRHTVYSVTEVGEGRGRKCA